MTTTTTKPARVLTEEQNHELWELFCSYGRLRWETESALMVGRNLEDYRRLRREADAVQERYADLIWSLTERPTIERLENECERARLRLSEIVPDLDWET